MSGAGFGISGLRGLVGAISPNHRASVISAFYLAADVSLSVPAVLAGLVVNPLGLRVTLETFGLIAALIAVVVAASAGAYPTGCGHGRLSDGPCPGVVEARDRPGRRGPLAPRDSQGNQQSASTPKKGTEMDVASLADLLHETAQHHDSYEKVAPTHDWWDWYAAYLQARQSGAASGEASEAADRYMTDVKGVATPG